MLDSDWLPRAEDEPRRVGNVLRHGAESRKSVQCIKIGDACIKIWNRVFSVLWDFFGTVRFFEEKIQNFLGAPSARAYIYYVCE